MIRSLYTLLIFFSTAVHGQTLSVRVFSADHKESIEYRDNDSRLRLSPSKLNAIDPPAQISIEKINLGNFHGGFAFEENRGRSEGLFSRQVSLSLPGIDKTLWADTDIRATHDYRSLSFWATPKWAFDTRLCRLVPHVGAMLLDVNVNLADQTYGVRQHFQQWVAMPLAGAQCDVQMNPKIRLFSGLQVGYMQLQDQHLRHMDASLGVMIEQGPWGYSIGKRFHRLSYSGSRDQAALNIKSYRSPLFFGLHYSF